MLIYSKNENITFKQKAAIHLVEKKTLQLRVCTLPVSTILYSQNRQSKNTCPKKHRWAHMNKSMEARRGGGGGRPPPYVALIYIIEDTDCSSVLTHMLVGKCTQANCLEFVDVY